MYCSFWRSRIYQKGGLLVATVWSCNKEKLGLEGVVLACTCSGIVSQQRVSGTGTIK